MPSRSGRAKKNQKSWTRGGVVRNTSMTKPAGQASNRRGESRSSASVRPSARPIASATTVTRKVLSSPCSSKSALARTGEKSQRYMKQSRPSGGRLHHLLHDRRHGLGVEPEVGQRLLVPLLRLSALVVALDRLVDPVDECRVALSDADTRCGELRRGRHDDLALAELLPRRQERRVEHTDRIDAA